MKNLLKIFAPENRSLLITLLICTTAITCAIILRPGRYQLNDDCTVIDKHSGRIYLPLHKLSFNLDGSEYKMQGDQ